MSGVVKGVKKVFKKVVKVVKKIAKPLMIAAAIYFTAGLALSAFPATASFAAALPGFAGGGVLGLGIGAGATAGTGVFTTLATTLGVGGGLTAASTGITSGAAAAAAAADVGIGAATTAAVTADTAAITGIAGAASSGAAGATMAAAAQGALAPTVAKAGMALSDKLLLASTGTKALGTLLQPSAKKQHDIANSFSGAFYGMDSKGRTATPGFAPPATAPKPATTVLPAKKTTVPDTTLRARQLIADGPAVAEQQGAKSGRLIDEAMSESPRFV